MASIIKSLLFLPIAALILIAAPSQSQAVDITLDSISGVWIETTGAPGVSGIGTNEIRWGTSTGSGQSGYQFDPAPTIFPVSVDTPFILGDFTHFNNPIFGSSIDSAKLFTTVDLTVDGTPVTGLNFTFSFLHNETVNSAPCGGGSVSVCDDIVEFLNNDVDSILTDSFEIDGVDYTIQLTGFEKDGQLIDQFLTEEGKDNIAQLEAVITSDFNVEVPEPSTYILMATALFGVALIQMRRKNSKVKK